MSKIRSTSKLIENNLYQRRFHPGLLRFIKEEAEGGYGNVWRASMALIPANQIPEGVHGELRNDSQDTWFVTTGDNGRVVVSSSLIQN